VKPGNTLEESKALKGEHDAFRRFKFTAEKENHKAEETANGKVGP